MKKWTPDTSVSFTYFGPNTAAWQDNNTKNSVVPSPNGRYFYLLSNRGDLACMCNVQRLDVYDSNAVSAELTKILPGQVLPIAQVEMKTLSQSNGLAILWPQWDPSGKSISFTGRDSADLPQLYVLDVSNNKVTQVTNDPIPKQFGQTAGGSALYLREVPNPPYQLDRTVVGVPRNADGQIQLKAGSVLGHSQWVSTYKGGRPIVMDVDLKRNPDVKAQISPSGSFAALTRHAGLSGRPTHFELMDLRTGQVSQLVAASAGAPIAAQGSPAVARSLWTPDSRNLILVNSALPSGLAGSPGAAPDAGYILSYDLARRSWSVIEPVKKADGLQLSAIFWKSYGTELAVQHSRDGVLVDCAIYAPSKSGWRSSATVPEECSLGKLPGGLRVEIRESENDPPKVVASNGTTELILSEPDKVLESVWRAPVETFGWTDKDGTKVVGDLSLPRGSEGKRVPLVIQLDGKFAGRFFPDGSVPACFARQSLNAKGFAVLQMPTHELVYGRNPHPMGDEGQDVVDRIDSAVAALAERGLIDSTKVGLIGFSRTGFQVHYAVTHPGTVRIAAAEVCDAYTGSYAQYLRDALGGRNFRDFENTIGAGKAFWQDKEAWLERDPSFNVDKVEAPTLFVEHGGDGGNALVGLQRDSTDRIGLEAISVMGSWSLNKKPFDFMFIPEGSHPLPGTRVRRAGQELVVAWMAFWLLGEEDPDPDKADWYRRWHKVRDLAVQNEPSVLARRASLAQVRTTRPDLVSELAANGIPEPRKDVQSINKLGYQLLYERSQPALALKVFRWNLELFPQYASQLYDSLAEGYVQAGQIAEARAAYEEIGRLNKSQARYVKMALERLLKAASTPAALKRLQAELRDQYRAAASVPTSQDGRKTS